MSIEDIEDSAQNLSLKKEVLSTKKPKIDKSVL